MASKAPVDDQQFTGQTQGWASGVNARDMLSNLAPDEARVIENGILDERGAFSKRLGCWSNGTFGVGGDLALSMHTFDRGSANVPQVILQTTAGKLYYTVDPWANPVVWTQITTGLSTTSPLSFETFGGKVYMSNGVDSYASWDGATYTTFPSAPKARYLRLWKDTMWASGVPGLDDRTYESAAGDPETWPVASWIDISKGDGDRTTGLGTDGFTLIVFKRNRHMAIVDPVTLQNRVVDFEKGCESHFSIIQFEGFVYFLSRRGFCKYFGDSPSQIISYKLDPVFTPSILNLAALDTCRAYVVENRIGWSLPEVGSAVPTMQIEYYPRLGPISPFGTVGIGPFAVQRMPSGIFVRVRSGNQETLFGAKTTANKFLQMFAAIGTDDGATFTAILETGPYNFGAPTRTKYIRSIRFLGRGDFTCQIKRNYETSSYKAIPVSLTATVDVWSLANLWGSGNWGPDSVVKELRVNPDAYGRAFVFRFSDSSTDLGSKLVDVGSREYSIATGKWGIYMVVFDGTVLGVRD